MDNKNILLVLLLAFVVTASAIQNVCQEEPAQAELDNLLATLTAGTHESFDMLARFRDFYVTNDIEYFTNITRSTLPFQNTRCRNSGISSDVNVAANCPWHYVINHDQNRRPTTIAEAKCNCRRHRSCIDGMVNSHCEPVKYNIRVLRKYGCENGKFLYKPTFERITVGCTCVIRN